jgi:small-conductance mechanosensitive channel
LALEAIKSVSQYAKTNEAEFVKRARAESLIQYEQTAKSHKKRIAKMQKRVVELNMLIKRIYEDFVAERLNEKRFEVMLAEYEQEQAALEPTIVELQAELDSFNADNERVDQFMALAKRYTDFTELTPMMIGEFIEKIMVHEADKTSGERTQDLEIYLNFIGKFDVPMAEPAPEEIEAEEVARLKREKRREAQRRYVARQEQKRLLEMGAEKKTA